LEHAPTFLNFHMISAHHPYGVRLGFRGPRSGDDRRTRYLNSIAYTDHVLGRMVADVERRSGGRGTLVVVTGDHGQAFGDKHDGNFTHRNHLYEENVRSFALFAMIGDAAARSRSGIVSERIGSLGDLMPSVLSLLGMGADGLAGQDLFGPSFTPRTTYFHKDAGSQQWGLRDGHWKFIDRVDGGAPELYDLAQDPNEQANVAARHPDMVETYRALVRDWYVRSNYDYIARLSGYRPPEGGAITRSRIARRGLRDVRVGEFLLDDFVERQQIHADARPTVYMRWFVNERTLRLRIRLVSPTRRVYVYPTSVGVDASSSWYRVPLTALESGRWTVDVWSGMRRVGRTSFTVR
jgi:hypothetical protein